MEEWEREKSIEKIFNLIIPTSLLVGYLARKSLRNHWFLNINLPLDTDLLAGRRFILLICFVNLNFVLSSLFRISDFALRI